MAQAASLCLLAYVLSWREHALNFLPLLSPRLRPASRRDERLVSAGAGSSSSPLPSVTLTDPSRSRKRGLSALTSAS